MQTDSQPLSKRINIRSTSILMLTALIWGMAFVAQRVGMDFIGPFLFMGIRMAFGAITLLVVLIVSDLFARIFPSRKGSGASETDGLSFGRVIKAGIPCGLILFLAGSLQQVGLVFTTASKAGFLTALYIVLVPILGIALRHKTHWNTWTSVLVAAAGLYFLCLEGGTTIEFGDLLMLLGAFFWACHILVIDHSVDGLSQKDVMKLCIAQFGIAAVLGFIATPFLDPWFVTEAFNIEGLIGALPTVLYTGILSTGVAFTLQAVGQQGMNPSAASIIMSLESVFSVIGGMLILGEVLSGREWFGCALMFTAVIISQLPVAQRRNTG